MTHRKAEAILGFPVEVSEQPSMKLFFAYGHVAGYPKSTATMVIGRGRDIEKALVHLVDQHYEWQRRQIFQEQKGLCLFCGGSLRQGMELDHIEMRSHGRSDVRSNLRLLDTHCHERRHRPKPHLSISGQPTEADKQAAILQETGF